MYNPTGGNVNTGQLQRHSDNLLNMKLSNPEMVNKNPIIHITLRGPIKAEVIWHASDKAFSVLMFNREKSSRPLLLDPLPLSAGQSVKNQFKFVLLQIECIMREELGALQYSSTYSTARDINLPKELIGYESTTMCVEFSMDDLTGCLSLQH